MTTSTMTSTILWRYNPEGGNAHSYRSENLKFNTAFLSISRFMGSPRAARHYNAKTTIFSLFKLQQTRFLSIASNVFFKFLLNFISCKRKCFDLTGNKITFCTATIKCIMKYIHDFLKGNILYETPK